MQEKPIIPQMEDATDLIFYCSHAEIDGYGLETAQPKYLGWYDKDACHGCHFNAKVFRGERWVLGRYIIEASNEDFMAIQKNDKSLTAGEFNLSFNAWLAAAGQADVIEWWLNDCE